MICCERHREDNRKWTKILDQISREAFEHFRDLHDFFDTSFYLFKDFLSLRFDFLKLLKIQHTVLTMHLWNRCIVIKFFFFIETILLKTQMSHEFYISLWRQSLNEIIDNYRRLRSSDDENSLFLNFLF